VTPAGMPSPAIPCLSRACRPPPRWVGFPFPDGAVQPHLDSDAATRRSTIRARPPNFRRSGRVECSRSSPRGGRHQTTFRMATKQQPIHPPLNPRPLLGIAPSAVGRRFSGGRVGLRRIGSSTSIAAVMADPIPATGEIAQRARSFAVGPFGMNTRLIGSGRYVSSLSASASSASPPARTPITPRCPRRFPGPSTARCALVGTATGA